MDSVLYASMDVVECNMPYVCENASMSVNPHNCDNIVHECSKKCKNTRVI